MTQETLKELRDRDFNLWVEAVADAIAKRDFERMDWDDLREEIEDMGASQKRALRSYFYRLVEHLLKLRDWHAEKERNRAKWRIEVTNFRREIKDILEDSPSLKNYLEDKHRQWQKKVFDSYRKNDLFVVSNVGLFPLNTILNEKFFG